MKLILSLSQLRHNSGGKTIFRGAKCPLCPLLEKSLTKVSSLVMLLLYIVVHSKWLTITMLYQCHIICISSILLITIMLPTITAPPTVPTSHTPSITMPHTHKLLECHCYLIKLCRIHFCYIDKVINNITMVIPHCPL